MAGTLEIDQGAVRSAESNGHARDDLDALAANKRWEDADPEETREWLESLDELIAADPERARQILSRLLRHARRQRVEPRTAVVTDYINTIRPEDEFQFPGDEAMDRRIARIVRWNAAAMVARANQRHPGIGGHISTYASVSALYEIAFNHFLRGKDAPGGGDQVYFQGHSTPGIYARAFVEGRLTEPQLDSYRTEVDGGGLSSYPHPRLMPDFWEFPTASMGLGVLNAIYQARFNRYLHARGIKDTSDNRVWCFAGDGEMEEPESLGALAFAARERLDNLVLVVNCNLQRLDGPVRGNGKVIQELEGLFTGAGWRVIKLIWGREWDPLFASDTEGVLVDRLNAIPDGEFQKYAVETGAYIREHAFGGDPRLAAMVEHLGDDDLRHLRRGGHDGPKIYSAFRRAVENDQGPTVVLAKTLKGWSLGPGFEGRNATHQLKKLAVEEAKLFRDRLELPIADSDLESAAMPYYRPAEDSPEMRYLRDHRAELGGPVPQRRAFSVSLPAPPPQVAAELLGGSGGSEASTTAAFVRYLRNLLRDPELGHRVVPIVPDEARTFGMDALFQEFHIYSSVGQLYEPVDANLLLSYRESEKGQIIEEGITEAGSMASFTAAGTAYATHGEPMIPFFIFYSMFGLQRVADLAWAFGDARGRGFLLGGTAGRTTLNGEGLQHQDGHSLVLATSVPNLRSYDPAFAYELAVILDDGLQAMFNRDEDVYYYVTLYNETYPMPAIPNGARDGILRGLYLLRPGEEGDGRRVQLLGSGSLVRSALHAQDLLRERGVAADVWSAPSYHELRRDALEVDRWNRLHPGEAPRVPYVTSALASSRGPIVAVTDWMKAVPDLAARWMPRRFVSLGTDGYGRSDTRDALRRHFEVDAEHIAVAALSALSLEGDIEPAAVSDAIRQFGIDPESASSDGF